MSPRTLHSAALLLALVACTPPSGMVLTTDTDGSSSSGSDGTTTTSQGTTGVTTMATETSTATGTATGTTGTTGTSTATTTDTGTTGTTGTGTTAVTGTTTDTGTTTEPPPACDDGLMNGDETDQDCGGSCGPCGDGLMCAGEADCQSGVCQDGLCAAPACDDGVMNGDETDLDCGGSCDPCGDGLMCANNFECQSGVCDGGFCAAPGCGDGVKNGTETDTDCGGDCDACEDGAACAVPEDCLSLICTNEICVASTCQDGVKNGAETAIDCGGPACAPCTLPNLIINEVDYDNVGNDTAEFIEIYNNTGAAVNLQGIQVVLVNGSNNMPYTSVNLGPGTLDQGKYILVGPPAMMAPPGVTKVNFALAQDNIQNGAPDGVALVDTLGLKLLDALSYEGAMNNVTVPGLGMISLVEGEAFPTADSNVEQASLARIPNGNDKNNAKTDWAYTKNPTPGAANLP